MAGGLRLLHLVAGRRRSGRLLLSYDSGVRLYHRVKYLAVPLYPDLSVALEYQHAAVHSLLRPCLVDALQVSHHSPFFLNPDTTK